MYLLFRLTVMAEYVEPGPFSHGLSHFTHPLDGHKSSSASFRKRKCPISDEEDYYLSEDQGGPSAAKKFVSEEQMASCLQQLKLATPLLPSHPPPPHRGAASTHDSFPRQPADCITASHDGRSSHAASDGGVCGSSEHGSLERVSWSESDSVFDQDDDDGTPVAVSPPAPRTLELSSCTSQQHRDLQEALQPSLDDPQTDSDSSDGGGGGEAPERPLSIWIALELQNLRKDHLLPPSIVRELHKPKGMEVIPWVDPNTVLKPSESTHHVMEEQAVGAHGNHGRPCSMESIEEESEQEDEGLEMEP